MLYALMEIGRRIRGSIGEAMLRNREAVQGVRIEYDGYWLQQLQGRASARWGWPVFEHDPYYRMRRYEEFCNNPESFEPPFWRDYLEANGLGEGSPVIVTFVVRNPDAVDRLSEVAVQDSNVRYRARVEYRPQARGYARAAVASTKVASAAVGVKVPRLTEGTLGGVLRGRSRASRRYLVSCAHVLSDVAGTEVFLPSPRHKRASVVARVSYGIMPPPMSSGASCSTAGGAEYAVDAAAAEVDVASSVPPTSFPKVDAVRPIKRMSQGDTVWFSGAASRRVNGQVNSLSLWHEIEIEGRRHCFANLFVIEPPKPWYVNAPLARPGDSGTWILSADSYSVDWNGMLVGGDGALVYCSFAEKVMAELRAGGIDAIV